MIVVDASIGVKWINKIEINYLKAATLLQDHISKKQTLAVPDLFFLEIANYLVTATSDSEKTIKQDLHFLNHLNLVVEYTNIDDLLAATILARKYKTTVYDMLYAVIAKKHNAYLITADDRFCRLTKFSHVKLL